MIAPEPNKPESSIAVIGGGIVGLSVAWRLAQRGWRVTLYEKSTVGGEASWAGAGMLSPGGEVDAESELAFLAVQSRKMYASFVRELEHASELSIDYQDCGALELAFSTAELEALETRAAWQAGFGIPSKAVDARHVHAFWPLVRTEGLVGGRFYPEDGIVNPREMIGALTAACRKLPVSIVEGCAVERVRVAQDCVTILSEGGEQIFKAAVLAAGAWSSSIYLAGLPPVPTAEPVRGHLIGYAQPSQTCNTIIRYGRTYLLQRANGLLIAGASVEHVGFNRDLEPEIVALLTEDAGFILPHLTETTPSETWLGFRPGSDALHIGPWHSERLYLAYGHYRNGILLAPVTAERIATAITSSLGMP